MVRGPLLFLAALALALPASGRADRPTELRQLLGKRCRSGPGLGLLVSPERPTAGKPLRVVVVAQSAPRGARLVGLGPDGPHRIEAQAGGGPPYFWIGRVDAPTVGVHRFALLDEGGEVLACRRRSVQRRWPDPPLPGGQWAVRRSWSRITESLYAAWIERLFDAPARTQPSWTPLHAVIRDPERNLLYNHLGSDEDGPSARTAVVVQPDCADLPYFLRAYFSWKLALPFGFRHCDRGSARRATRCGELRSNLGIPSTTGRPAERFSRFLRTEVGLVHSGAGRTAPDDDETDLYPVSLSRPSLRPGTVYVDPYGHLLVIARWIAPAGGAGGLLYAVDGHPDLSVGRKRFWKGAFLFSDKIEGGAGGFKAFRPLVVRGGSVEALTNDEIRKSGEYGNHSAEQYRLGIEGFYDRVDAIINPTPLAPTQAYKERLEALHELVLERVGSVQVGEEYMKKTGYRVVPMPSGPRIFETAGAWEDYSTPARDMRLLIALEEIRDYPAKVVARPKRFALPSGQTPEAARSEMARLYERFTRDKGLTYVRSDGRSQTLSLAELIRRAKGLEIAYNPNDCVELRWAAEGAELASCRRHAPEDQKRRMAQYRSWFATRTRPPLR